MKMLLQIDYLLLLLHKHSSEAIHKQALSDRIQTGVEDRLSSKHTPKAMARGYAIVTQLPVSAQDSSIHQMLHGVTTLTGTASSLATTSIRLTAGAQATSLNYLSIS